MLRDPRGTCCSCYGSNFSSKTTQPCVFSTAPPYLHACAGTNRAGERFPYGTRFIPCETGRISFERGQFYQLGLALTSGSPWTPEMWVRSLEREPRLKRNGPAPLADNVRLSEVEDLVAGQRLGPRAHAVWLDEEHLNVAARPLAGQTSLTVHFQSPLLILRTPVDKGDVYVDERVFLPEVFLARVQRAVAEWFPALAPAGDPPACQLTINGVVSAETVYHGTKPKVLPGSLGNRCRSIFIMERRGCTRLIHVLKRKNEVPLGRSLAAGAHASAY